MSQAKTTTLAGGKARYGLVKDDGQWLTRPELFPTVGLTSSEAAHRRGWGHDSTARTFLSRHPELRRAGFKVRPIDD